MSIQRFVTVACTALIMSLGVQVFAQDTEELMEMSLEDILNMEVTTASKSAEKLSDAPGVISVVTKDELDRFGGTTLRDIVERVPGLISSGANYTNRTTIAPRGDQIKQNSSHVLILINGRPVREVQEGGVSSDVLETFPVNIIERIEVIKGPGSVLYGSDAFSGVVNIITKKAEGTGLSVTGLAQNEGGYATSGDVSAKLGDLAIVAAGRFYQKSEWETDFKTTYSPSFFVPGIDTTIRVSIPNKGPGAYLGANYKGLSLMSSYHQWMTYYFSASSIREVELKKYFTNVGYHRMISASWDADLNLTYAHSGLVGEQISKRSSYNLVAEWTNSITLGTKTKVVAGGLYNKNSGEESSLLQNFPAIPLGTVVSKGDVNSFAFYAQLDYRLLESLKLIGGMQANKVENIKLNVVPRAGLIWYPAPRLNVKALYSEAFRAPSINEVNMNFGGFLTGNPKLKPEDVQTADLSLSYQGEQAQVGVNLFQSKMTNIVQIEAGTYRNNANVTYKGIECEGKYYVTRRLFLNGSVLYQTNENDSLKNLAPIAKVSTKAGISYAWDKGITIGLFDLYQGDLDDKFKGNRNPNQGTYNVVYLHSKFNLTKLFALSLKQDLSLLLNIDNLLDKEHFGYDLGGSTFDGIPSVPGRAIYLGLNATLR